MPFPVTPKSIPKMCTACMRSDSFAGRMRGIKQSKATAKTIVSAVKKCYTGNQFAIKISPLSKVQKLKKLHLAAAFEQVLLIVMLKIL